MGHLAGNGREAFQELIQSVVPFQILEQRPYRNTGFFENGRASEYVGIDGDEIRRVHDFVSVLQPSHRLGITRPEA